MRRVDGEGGERTVMGTVCKGEARDEGEKR